MNVASREILALITDQMASEVEELKSALEESATWCSELSTFMQLLKRYVHAVVLLPVTLSSQEWFSIWAVVNTLDLNPSILIYALRTDFSIWTGALEAGAFDVVVAPFTQEKVGAALSAAAEDFSQRRKIL